MKKLLKQFRKRKRGITLVSLVITIIILLILVGVVIETLGDNGLFEKTKMAKQKYAISEAKEKLELKIIELRIEEEGKGEILTKEDLPKLNNDEIDVGSIESFPIEVIYQGYKFNIDENFNIIYIGEAIETIVTYTTDPNGYTNQDNITVKIKITNSRGIETILYPNGNKDISCNGKKTIAIDYSVNKNGTYIFKIIDKNGKETEKEIVIQKIDKINPKEFTTTIEDITIDGFKIVANTEDGDETSESVKSGIEKYEYFVKKDGEEKYKKYESKEGNYIISGLNQETKYKVYVVAYDKAGNYRQTEEITATTEAKLAKLYLIPTFESDGKSVDISRGTEYSTIEEAVDAAVDGNILYFTEGKFKIQHAICTGEINRDSSAIYDKDKQLIFMGENEKSIISYNNQVIDNYQFRDGNLIALGNSNSIIRNLYFDFYVYYDAYCGDFLGYYPVGLKGSIKNCYFNINTEDSLYRKTSYGTAGNYSGTIENCTFYFEGFQYVDTYYNIPKYSNIVTNYAFSETSNGGNNPNYHENIVVKDILGNILNTKTDKDLIDAQAGVYFGEYAWK